MSEFVTIPIFSDNSIHPLHSHNELSLLYVKELGKKSSILTINHPDQFKSESFDFLKGETLITPNKKFLLYIYPFERVYDIDMLNYYLYNTPLDIETIRPYTLNVLYNRYYAFSSTNNLIPIEKHLEYCDNLAVEIEKVWNMRQDADFESYELYNTEAVLAYYSIDKQGIRVSDLWDKSLKNNISNGTVYSDYNLYTSTGRPSNSFGGINFAALDDEKRKYIIPNNDMFVEFDYDAFHIRLIANLIGYKFPDGSVHDHLAKQYGTTREEGKKLTFQYLYGNIPWDIIQSNPFFDSVNNLIGILWKEFNDTGKIETPIYKRPILKRNHKDITKTKLFNYYMQAIETEQNIKTIIKLQRYLYMIRSSLILYTYDSFLIDFDKQDGEEALKNIKKILESDIYLTKAKAGFDYSSMRNITNKL